MCQGIIEMKDEVRDETRLESIKNVMEGLKYTAQQAMDLLKIPADDRARYLEILQEKNRLSAVDALEACARKRITKLLRKGYSPSWIHTREEYPMEFIREVRHELEANGEIINDVLDEREDAEDASIMDNAYEEYAESGYKSTPVEDFWAEIDQAEEEDRKKGIYEGEEKTAHLVMLLLRDGRNDDLLKLTDEEHREKLFHEYNMDDWYDRR